MPAMPTPIIRPGQLEVAAGDIPELRLPDFEPFARRARRLRQLAVGHSLGDYLVFAAAVAETQQTQLDRLPALPMPDADLLAHCREHGMPPLAPGGWPRAPVWRSVAMQLVDALDGIAPEPARAAFARLRQAGDEWLESQANLLLAGDRQGLDRACAPVIGAALQVCWTRLAAALDTAWITRPESHGLCPVCGSPPVAGIVRIGDAEDGLRYLHCALCGTEWHVVRAQCSHCDNDKGIVYYTVEDRKDPVQAEACPECGSYLKLCRMDQDPDVEPSADDLASLALDLLMSEEGFARSGVNYLMLQGDG
jgi:FdhE protein